MKKTIILLLSIVLLLSAASCNRSHANDRFKASSDLTTDQSTSRKDSVTDQRPSVESSADTAPTEESPKNPEAPEELNISEIFSSRPLYMLGSNMVLRDNLKVHIFFVEDNESSWTAEEIDLYMKHQINLGLNYLEEQAQSYGIKLNISTKCYATSLKEGYTLKYEGTIKDGSDGTHTLNVIDHVARDLGYSNEQQMYLQLYEENNHCEVVFLSVVNKDGVSYAIQQADGDIYTATIESALVFTTYLNKSYGIDDNTDLAATVAHEILHVYGAIDLYLPDQIKQFAQKKYPQDIMLSDYIFIEKMNVGAFTAFSVGWLNKAPSIE